MLAATLKNLPNDPNNPRSFPAYTYRFDLERKVGEEWENADNCELSPVGQTKNIHPVYNAWKDIVYSNNGLSIPEDCPIGPYRVKFVLKDEHNAEFVSDKREFTVLLGPSVTIEMPAGPHYRGTSIDATIKFHELIQGASYTYEAYVMNDNPNYADNCEGTGLARNEIFSLGSVDENPEVRTGTITSSCPKENYDLTVRLFNAENRIKATKSEVFNITTNPAAIPSVSVAMSEASPVTPGTEFDVIFNFYDLQDDTAIRYLDTLTNTGTNQPVGGMDCGGSLVGWGQDVSATVIRNPIVNRVTITSDCPVGSYRLKSVIQDNSGNEIISGSIDFDIGDPDLTPTAPSVLNFTAKQNSYFSQQLPTGSGGDGTLSYGATGLPAGLSFNSSTRTIAGTPSGHGIATVTYTVTDADGDPDSVQFTITVAQDFFPSPPVILNFTGRVGRYFEQQISRGTGDDLPLSFSVTDLPDGLDFFQDTHMITGTPTKQQSPTVTYTVRDGDQDEERTTFTIEVSANNTPTLDNLSTTTYPARVGVLFTKKLPAGSGGDGDLVHTATNLPDGLTFDQGTQTVTGRPTTVESRTVTYTVQDEDQDEASTTFMIEVSVNNTPTLDNLSTTTYPARVGVLFTKKLPAGSGGDGDLVHTATNLPDGLTFDQGTQTVTGRPTTVESKTVTYAVRDEDQDEAGTTFTIEVSVNNTPTLDNLSTTTYPARVGVLFTKKLPAGSGGDGDLVHTATNLPDGLTFDQGTQTVTGRPTTVESKTVTYAVRDEDQDEAGTTFTIEVSVNNTPTLDNLSTTTYPARVGVLFTKKLPAGSGGDGDLVHTATNLPDGLTHFRPGNADGDGQADNRGIQDRDLRGARRRPGRGGRQRHDLRGYDQDEAGTTFTIEVGV